MNFISINEYFYKFHSMLLAIALIPIFAFILLYLRSAAVQTNSEIAFESFIAVAGVVLFLWLFMLIFFNKKIKSIRNRQGLREKLEKYFRLTIVRYSTFSGCGLVLATAFYLVSHNFFSALFLVQLMIMLLLWPTAAKVSRDLRLRGAEREMVYYRKDKL